MSHAFVTVIAPLALDRLAATEAAISALRNPAAPAIKAALDKLDAGGRGTHFASLHAVRSQDGKRGYIAFEFSADGTEDEALERIEYAIGGQLKPVFLLAADWKGGELLAYLRAHRVTVGCGWFANPGVVFSGTPGLTVGRIRQEAELAKRVTTLVGETPAWMDALARVNSVREALAKEPAHRPALEPATAVQPFKEPPLVKFVTQLLVSFAKTYLWPVAALVLVWAVIWGVWTAIDRPPGWSTARAFLDGAWIGLRDALWTALVWLVLIGGFAYLRFRRAEATDSLEERAPSAGMLAGMFERENQRGYMQNHMISVTQRKPGAIRCFTSRLVFWAVGEFATRKYRPGFLSDIGTIHFARWVTAPGSPDILFFSNFGGSWESYLEDFITRAHAGLTGIWSNSIGFPRSENLFQRGATDGERFKRYARQSMAPTPFWYSAYPRLTTANIRANAEIRRGLSGSMTEDEALCWLALFGSAARPIEKLLSNEIQSLVFGGLGFLPFGTCLLFDLPDHVPTARKWLADVLPDVAFNDGRRLIGKGAVATLALGANGLRRLGLPEAGLATFPFAFLDGMRSPSRVRILGDAEGKTWTWGNTQPDVALLVYGDTQPDVDRLEQRLIVLADQSGMAKPHRIPLKEITDNKEEAFGFVDGISQPVIRGTYKSLRNADPIHLVEPGEFILGYPDNRGNVPPGPTLSATADPDNRLPLVGGAGGFAQTVVENDRDLGFNGSFLVIRQLEQDVDGFKDYCAKQANTFAKALPPPYNITPEFIGAKLVGRWQDGSSLTRYPYEPRSNSKDATKDTMRPTTNPASQAFIAAAPGKLAAASDVATAAAASAAGAAVAVGVPVPVAAAIAAAAVNVAPAAPKRRRADNDFLFGTEDPEALRCPFGSHIRRANPRDSFDPGSSEQVAISNRHRILRVGRQYEDDNGRERGLLFMCLNGDIERQFEFVQQTWLMSPSFHGLSCEKDPLLGDGETGACGFTAPSRHGPLALSSLPSFIATKGGGYFFMPGKRLIEYLSTP